MKYFDSTLAKQKIAVEQETVRDYLENNNENHILTGMADLGIAYVLSRMTT